MMLWADPEQGTSASKDTSATSRCYCCGDPGISGSTIERQCCSVPDLFRFDNSTRVGLQRSLDTSSRRLSRSDDPSQVPPPCTMRAQKHQFGDIERHITNPKLFLATSQFGTPVVLMCLLHCPMSPQVFIYAHIVPGGPATCSGDGNAPAAPAGGAVSNLWPDSGCR